MNLIVAAPVWLIGLLLVVLLAAAIEDAIRLRISNLTSLAVFVAAIVAMALHGFPLVLWQNLIVFFVILALGALAFSRGWLGGGDVKLLAALGLWVNFSGALLLISGTFVAGGVVALLYLAARLVSPSKITGQGKGRQIPYGLAITAGALLTFVLQHGQVRQNPYIAKLQAQRAAERSR
jgi:prepilin peptidase CpaA